jgi:hypothetical protein
LNFYCKNQAGGFINILSLVVQQAHGFCVSGRTVRIETFEQLITFGAGRQFTVSKAHQRQARKPLAATLDDHHTDKINMTKYTSDFIFSLADKYQISLDDSKPAEFLDESYFGFCKD